MRELRKRSEQYEYLGKFISLREYQIQDPVVGMCKKVPGKVKRPVEIDWIEWVEKLQKNKCEIIQGLRNYVKDFWFYSACDGKPLDVLSRA